MKICAQNPIQAEYSLCGDAFDIGAVDTEPEKFEFAQEVNEDVTCANCKNVIAHIHQTFTPKGKLK